MDRLPLEIIEMISTYLKRKDLKSTLTLSQKFHYAAERYSRYYDNFKLTEHNEDCFIKTYFGVLLRGRKTETMYRLRFLRRLVFQTLFEFPLENHRDFYRSCRETRAHRAIKDKSFTRQIKFLFNTLKACEDELKHDFPKYELEILTPMAEVDPAACDHHLFPSWRVQLLNPESLPELHSVTSLEVRTGAEYTSPTGKCAEIKPNWRVLVDLIVKLPRLQRFSCELGGHEWSRLVPDTLDLDPYQRDWEGPRRDSRHGFGAAMMTLSERIPKNLTAINIDFLYRNALAEEVDHRMEMPDLVSPAAYDPLSIGLQLLSRNLKQIRISACVDQSLFWPQDTTETPTWPNLESLEVIFHPVTPSGSLYFEGPEGEGSGKKGFIITEDSYPPLRASPDDRAADRQASTIHNFFSHSKFRVIPTDSELSPLLGSFAKAAANMPSLREFLIWAPLQWDPEAVDEESGFYLIEYQMVKLAWGIAYAAPHQFQGKTDTCDQHSHARQIWWEVADWRPNPSLLGLFRRIGERQHGVNLKEHWRDGEYGHELCERTVFEEMYGERLARFRK